MSIKVGVFIVFYVVFISGCIVQGTPSPSSSSAKQESTQGRETTQVTLDNLTISSTLLELQNTRTTYSTSSSTTSTTAINTNKSTTAIPTTHKHTGTTNTTHKSASTTTPIPYTKNTHISTIATTSTITIITTHNSTTNATADTSVTTAHSTAFSSSEEPTTQTHSGTSTKSHIHPIISSEATVETSKRTSMSAFTRPTTANTSTVSHADKGHKPGTTLEIFLGVICSVAAVGLVAIYIWQKRKRSYIPCTFRSCRGWFEQRTRSSSSGSHGPLTMEDTTSIDIPETRQERELFSIGDQDGGQDGRPSPRATRRSMDDDYFYDEIFERSAFVDAQTNKTNKDLTIDTDDDELDIPDLVFKRPSSRY